MSCKFSLGFRGNADEMVAKAKKVIDAAGGQFQGDSRAGDFIVPTPLGEIDGSYTVDGKIVQFNIPKKPVLVACNTIKDKIRGWLGVADNASVDAFNLDLIHVRATAAPPAGEAPAPAPEPPVTEPEPAPAPEPAPEPEITSEGE